MLTRVARKLQGRSTGEIAALVGANLRHLARGLSPEGRAARERDGAFDRRWGTDTCGLVNLSDVSVDRARARAGVRYQASDGSALAHGVRALGVDPGGWSFVDLGCGKGRIVMLAAAMGFARTFGVEFAPELAGIARANCATFVARGGAERAPKIVLGDAGAFAPAPGPLLLYLYNPFGPPVIDEVIDWAERHAASGAAVAVIYVDPRHRDRFSAGRWTGVEEGEELALLRAC
jgi:SAM-dependent methyltransferase